MALPGWAAMEKCVVEQGRAVGVEPAQTLAHVERAGPWIRAVDTVNPLREKLQRSFLPGGVAKTQDEMGIDELRVAQVYVYGLAQHLADCRAHATGFARSAGLSNPDMPLKDYDEERWDPRLAEWQRMELASTPRRRPASAQRRRGVARRAQDGRVTIFGTESRHAARYLQLSSVRRRPAHARRGDSAAERRRRHRRRRPVQWRVREA